jgi:hypothetical protein
VACSLHLLIFLALLASGCSRGGTHPPVFAAPSPQTPPFNSSAGEGHTVGTPSMLAYATGSSSTQTRLDIFTAKRLSE